ncbi:hypothetical protein ACWEQL_31940 [Kitasatospora sp. NPDC004240]
MAAEDAGAGGTGAQEHEDRERFEQELVIRLGEQAGARELAGGPPPLAELKEAGRRRQRRQNVLRAGAGVAVLALGAGLLTQLGTGGGGGASGATVSAAGNGSPSPYPGGPAGSGIVTACDRGPSALRTPGWTGPTRGAPGGPSASFSASPGLPSSGVTSGAPGTGWPSGSPSGLPPASSGLPSAPSSAPSSGLPSGSPSSGTATGVPGSPAFTGTTPAHSAPAWPSSGPSSSGPSSVGSSGPASGLRTLPPVDPSAGLSASPWFTPPVAFYDTPAGIAGMTVAEIGQRYPDHYFGVCASSGLNTVYAIRVPGSDFDEAVRKALQGTAPRIEFVDAVGSRRALGELADRIQQDTGYWGPRGVTISWVQVAIDGAGLIVFSPQGDGARADILARYGRQVVEVRQGE